MSVKPGFTLIELLIVIAILAILSTAVVLVLNPAELLKQGRDSTRISDLAALNNATALLIVDVINLSWVSSTRCTAASSSFPGGLSGACQTPSTSSAVNGSGWVNLSFTSTSIGSPLPKLPTDPVPNSTTYFYAFKASTTLGKYKYYGNMESIKFSSGGTADVESNIDDGGIVNDWYELGSDQTL